MPTMSRPGQANSAGDDRALFLKLYGGEVLTAFTERNVMRPRHVVRTIRQGKSASFPAIWKATASYHTPGNPLTGQSISSNERIIEVDDMLVSDVMIADIDEAMSHYEFRSEYSVQCGAALARTFDTNLMQTAILAARASATVSGGNGGSQIIAANSRVDAQNLVDAVGAATVALSEKDVPKTDRYTLLSEEQYLMLLNSDIKAINKDYTNSSNADQASGVILRLFGTQLVPTNHFPSTNVTTGPDAYQGDFTNSSALVMHRSAIGTVELIGLSVAMDYELRNLGTLVVAKMAVGHGILRPESAVEIAVSA